MDRFWLLCFIFVCCAVISVPCGLVVTCWNWADLLSVVCVVFSCVCHFPKIDYVSWSKSELRVRLAP